MPTIFISYRRDDAAGYAGRLHERLSDRFGSDRVFMDIDDIPPGSDFASTIHSRVANCDVVLALIGPEWLGTPGSTGARRIDSKTDFVRQELEQALASGSRLIPLLVRKAAIPPASSLPSSLTGLTRLQAMDLSDDHWQTDVDRLIDIIDQGASAFRRRALRVGAGILGAALLASLWWVVSQRTAADISGTWEAEITYDWGDRYAERFELQVEDSVVTGTVSFLGVPRMIRSGSVEGDAIRLQIVTEEIGTSGRAVTHDYVGLIDSEGIQFTMETRGSSSAHTPIQFQAKRPR